MSGHQNSPVRKGATEQALSVDRVVAFSDGVMAIAGTLLAFNIKEPAEMDASFLMLVGHIWLQIQAYIISFAVVALYWSNHHRLFALLARVDGQLIALNFIFLGLICLLPFATSLISNDHPTSATVTFYALTVALIGFAHWAMWLKAVNAPELMTRPKLDFESRIRYRLRPLTPLYFLLSAIFAQYQPTLAMVSWLGLSLLLPVSRSLTRRLIRA
jgi:uncharacterized membrane protein